jgi:hypothetical protein
MSGLHSYDIHVLGLADASKAGRHRFANEMERLTKRPAEEFAERFPPAAIPIFQSLDLERAQQIADAMKSTGILIEIRVSDAPPSFAEPEDDAAIRECPACNHRQSAVNEECDKCGVVFKKFEREQLAQMQKEHTLEQAMIKAMQVREEWLHRAQQYLELHKIRKEEFNDFSSVLIPEEVPFLRLNSEEGPLLMTSRRMITMREGKFHSIPYEMVSDVDYGGGRIVTKKSKQRLQVNFHAPLPLADGEQAKNFAWHLDKESSFSKDVVIDWGYARNFICGSCGARELEYRTENDKVRMRCMHCATDHEIDLAECVAVPLIAE